MGEARPSLGNTQMIVMILEREWSKERKIEGGGGAKICHKLGCNKSCIMVNMAIWEEMGEFIMGEPNPKLIHVTVVHISKDQVMNISSFISQIKTKMKI